MIKTEAWVLPGPAGDGARAGVPGELRLERIALPEPGPREVLAEPLFGSWEANMTHALSRVPIDVCHLRGEDAVVLGNSGLVRVLRPGSDVTDLTEGTLCLLMPFGQLDDQGYAELAYAYDTPATIGLLAKRTVIPAHLLVPLPADTRHPLTGWAATARYFTAWDNWKVALACWRSQQPPPGRAAGDDDAQPAPLVFGWGGGVSYAELQLARMDGFAAAMTARGAARLETVKAAGIEPVDREEFPDLAFDEARYRADPQYADRYRDSERRFLARIRELSGGRGAAIFVDNIGGPLYKATLKALRRQGVLTTVGWKAGMRLWNLRATECIQRHLHVHTHVWCLDEVPAARDFMEETGWLPDAVAAPRPFEEIPALAEDYANDRIESYFPLYQVNPL